MPKCSTCQSDVANNSRFCASCGRPVNGDAGLETRTVASAASSRRSVTQPTPSRPADESRFLPGAVLDGRYRIVALLGKGGMGEVYRADDLTLGQQVALKFLPESLAGNPDSIARFRNEVRVARQVSHPNVCRVYDVGEIDGHFFLSMEYVDGEDLSSLLRRIGRLPADKALEIARRLCAGLAAAHEKGVLHRDLKPSNVMLDGRGQVLLTDFGLAGLAGEIAGNEIRSGTPAYMPPEQLEGREVTVRSDIYALGLVLYEIFTGKRPFEANTLADLVRVRTQTTPVSLTSLVRDLDPAVERVVLRCLDPDPSHRPSSALAVAAALPGGDPLAAALAAGETPSPDMVAAAGEGAGLSPRVAVPVFAAVILGLLLTTVFSIRSGALGMMNGGFSPEVLAQKARDVIQRLGYDANPADNAIGFIWDSSYLNYVQNNDKPSPRWNEVLSHRPSPLEFWYRQSPYPLTGDEYHDDMLTPGIVDFVSPPSIYSGMIDVVLDPQGRLVGFQAIPPQLQKPQSQAANPVNVPVDWSPLFAAAELDSTQLKPTEPLWTWMATSDNRMAWTGTWPRTTRPLRVEAAALRGKPIAFLLVGPWTDAWRMPPVEAPAHERIELASLAVFCVVILVGAALLARRNVKQDRWDRRGAIRLAFWIFAVQMALWVFRSHLAVSIGTFAMFLLALCTAVFYGVLMWTVYVALEPFVRRHWPQTMIGWTTLLSGRVRDPIVGRDVLLGAALGTVLAFIERSVNLWMLQHGSSTPNGPPAEALLGMRTMLGAWLMHVPQNLRNALFFFFLIFLMRVVLRNQWLAAGVFVVIFTILDSLGSADHPWVTACASLLIWVLEAIVVLRWGLLSVAVGLFVARVLVTTPATFDPSAWYFGNATFMLASIVALATWACYTSMAGQRLWKKDLFE